MKNGGHKPAAEAEPAEENHWRFGENKALAGAGGISIRGVLNKIFACVDAHHGPKPLLPLGHGDPSVFPSFRTTLAAEDAIVDALRSGLHNNYAPTVGVNTARIAIADYLSKDLPYSLSQDDVFVTSGCTQAIEVITTVLARPGANILLPRPGFPLYEARCAFSNLEVRHFDLVPEKGWEVDLDQVERISDGNTVAIVVINPSNPCGNVLTFEHMEKVANLARKLGIMIISDEVYDHLTFGNNPFIPMGVFGNITPILTLGSISKRWVVPGWRLGWIVTTDPKGILKKTKVVDSIKNFLDISTDPTTFIQGAIPHIIEKTGDEFFSKIICVLRETAEICYNEIKDIKCIYCPHKPEASMFVMVKLDVSNLEDITDDVDFCCKLAKEESVIVLPGSALQMKGWLRITFAVEPSSLELGLKRLKLFCKRHEKKN
ncbi:hypothetical protein LUZ60_012661 [Juncus effusus]|nr:hypothetical protein LUZ60_012661 [Juncus effusus]